MDVLTGTIILLAVMGAIGSIILAYFMISNDLPRKTSNAAYTYFAIIGIFYIAISLLFYLIFREHRNDYFFFALLGLFFTVVGYLNRNTGKKSKSKK